MNQLINEWTEYILNGSLTVKNLLLEYMYILQIFLKIFVSTKLGFWEPVGFVILIFQNDFTYYIICIYWFLIAEEPF